jgi:hypothetical protein
VGHIFRHLDIQRRLSKRSSHKSEKDKSRRQPHLQRLSLEHTQPYEEPRSGVLFTFCALGSQAYLEFC